MNSTKPCIICNKKLRSVSNTWEHLQPSNGGEVRFIFSYGSEKFDLETGNTEFRGVICDECAAKCMERVSRVISL